MHAVSSECAQCASVQSLEHGEVVPCKSLLSFKQLANTIFFMLERYMSGPHGTYKLTKRFTFPLETRGCFESLSLLNQTIYQSNIPGLFYLLQLSQI